tara:strand:+ start:2847 stop:3863 length:1017 start_codon:yes stop_codon:yes gene_type:complete
MDLITSYKIARSCDEIFSEELTEEQFNQMDKKDKFIYEEKGNRVSYINQNLSLSNGCSIFSKSDNVELLFKNINSYSDVNNLILVTSQDDVNIDKTLFKKLPSNFKKWYSINVNFISEKLISIPLGLANNYEKNLSVENYENFDYKGNYYKSKKNLLYINFNINTNKSERSNIYEHYSKAEWVKFTKPDSNLDKYIDNLKNSNFVFCPPGNGIDTHRLWETLYAGSIPIVKKNINNLFYENLPIFLYENLNDVNKESLKNFLLKDKEYDLNQLEINFWRNIFIKREKKNDGEITTLLFSENSLSMYKTLYKMKNIMNHYIKIMKFRINQVINLFLKKD